MATPATYTYQTDTAVLRGVIREDLSDIISNISPSETPLLSACRTLNATSTVHEWVEDTLTAPSGTGTAYAAQEGANPTVEDMGTGTRLSNNTQITEQAYGVSGTFEAVNSAGFDSALAYAGAKAARQLKNEVDYVIGGTTQAKAAADASTAPLTASLCCWVRNASRGGGAGADPTSFVGTATDTVAADGDCRVFTQTILDSVIEDCWGEGGRPTLLITGPNNRTKFSTFDGLGNIVSASTGRTDRATKTIIGTADVYMSNFGELSVVSSRHMRKNTNSPATDRDAWLIDPEQVGVAYLRPWQESDLAKTGDSINRQMVVEYALQVSNTYANGLCADLENA